MTLQRYERSKEYYDTAADAWEDIERRSGLSFEQVDHRDHTPQKWAWLVDVGGDDE